MDLSRSDDPGRKIYDMGPMAMKGRKMYDMGPVAMKGWLIQRRTAIPTREDTVAPGACSA